MAGRDEFDDTPAHTELSIQERAANLGARAQRRVVDVHHTPIGNENMLGVEHANEGEGLTYDVERNFKYLSVLKEELQVLYDRLTPILAGERPTSEDSEAMKEGRSYPQLRQDVRRQGRMILQLSDQVRDITQRIEL